MLTIIPSPAARTSMKAPSISSETDPIATGLPSSYRFSGSDAGSYTFNSVVLKTAGDQTIKATDTVVGTSPRPRPSTSFRGSSRTSRSRPASPIPMWPARWAR